MKCIDQIENFIDAKIEHALAGRKILTGDLPKLGRNVQITRGELNQCLSES